MNPLDIYKKLPRTNCGECTSGTCISFAVKLSKKECGVCGCPVLGERAKKDIEGMLKDAGDWKEKRLRELFEDISEIDFHDAAGGIGAECSGDLLRIEYMGKDIIVSHKGFRTAVGILDGLLILMYVKNRGNMPLSGRWVAFRDLKNGSVRSEAFHDVCEAPLAGMYAEEGGGLFRRLFALKAERVSGFPADESFLAYPLPNIPFLVLLWTGGGFAPACSVLLDSTATEFLDVESLLYLGAAFLSAVRAS